MTGRWFDCGVNGCQESTVYVLEGGDDSLPLCADHAAMCAATVVGLVPLAAFLPEQARVTL